MNTPFGLASMLAPTGDSTKVDPRIWAILQKRKQQQGPQPKINVAEDIKAVNAGAKSAPIDTNMVKMAHAQWLDHIDKLGYELTPKKKQ